MTHCSPYKLSLSKESANLHPTDIEHFQSQNRRSASPCQATGPRLQHMYALVPPLLFLSGKLTPGLVFFTGRECGGNIISIWGGSGTTACTSVGGDARSMGWLPYDSGRSIRVSSSGNCGNQANVFGPRDSGCRGFTANVAQGGVETFEII